MYHLATCYITFFLRVGVTRSRIAFCCLVFHDGSNVSRFCELRLPLSASSVTDSSDASSSCAFSYNGTAAGGGGSGGGGGGGTLPLRFLVAYALPLLVLGESATTDFVLRGAFYLAYYYACGY